MVCGLICYFCLRLVEFEIWGSKFTGPRLQLPSHEAHKKVPEKLDLMGFLEACGKQNEILILSFSNHHHREPGRHERGLHPDPHLAWILHIASELLKYIHRQKQQAILFPPPFSGALSTTLSSTEPGAQGLPLSSLLFTSHKTYSKLEPSTKRAPSPQAQETSITKPAQARF